MYRSIINSSFQRERFLMQSKSRQKSLQLHLSCIVTYDKNLNNSNCKTIQTHFNDSKINKIH